MSPGNCQFTFQRLSLFRLWKMLRRKKKFTSPVLICCLVSSHFKVDFGVAMKVSTVAIQGAEDGKGYIKSYIVNTKDYADGPWTQYRQNDKTKVGNVT